MQAGYWIRVSTEQLTTAGISTARLDCLVLLEDLTGKDRSWLLSHPEHKLQGSIIEILSKKIAQRAQHIPLAYIRGHAEFYGRKFAVDNHTLVPRPETEAMIELLKVVAVQPGAAILDIGTGSGCISITASLELPEAHVSACDIDMDCLKIAQENAVSLEANVRFFESNLLFNTGPHDRWDIVLANLPYVPNDYPINMAATHEPRLALFGGSDGMDLYRILFGQINILTAKPLYVLAESLPQQHTNLAAIAKKAGYSLHKTDDLIQLFALTRQPVAIP